MIFGRIIRSIKSENWSVAFIEMLMIVVGVFAAFQVDAWTEDRKEAKLEVLWLEAVREDLGESLPFVQGRVAFEGQLISNLDDVLRALEAGEVSPSKQTNFERGLQMRFTTPTAFQLIGTIQQLNADGQMNEIKDADLRRMLIGLIGYAAAYDKNVSGIEESFRKATYHSAKFYELGFDLDIGRPYMVSYDLEAMRADPQFKMDIIYIRGLHGLAKGANETFAERLDEVILALDATLGDVHPTEGME